MARAGAASAYPGGVVALANVMNDTSTTGGHVYADEFTERFVNDDFAKFTGTLTQTRHIFVPTNKKLYVVMNQTNEYLSFECTAGSIGAVIAPQAPSIGDVYTLLYCDGTNVYKITGT